MSDSTVDAVFVGVCKEIGAAGSKSAVLISIADPRGPRWTPTSNCCSLPCSARLTMSCLRAARTPDRVTDAEVVTLCVVQAIMGVPSDRRFPAVAAKRLGHLFPDLPQQSGYFKCRRRPRTQARRRSANESNRSSGPAKTSSTLERHGARILQGLRERVIARFCCIAAAITLNHQIGRPSRAPVNYCA